MFRIFTSAEPGPQLTWTAMNRDAIRSEGDAFQME
jgi:hypothetical protein